MNSISPEISIIVPVYKVEQYLDRCVESILKQTFTDFELILVDDGSPDNCPKMCDEWAKKDSRIKVIHKKNGGLSSARNAGLDVARGKYIGFVDSDDWINESMYEVLFRLLYNSDHDISICGFIRTDTYPCIVPKQNKKITIWTRNDFLKGLLKVKTQNSNQYAWNKLYKRSVLKGVRYPEGLTDEDVEGTFCAVLNSKSLIETSQVEYYYYVNPQSITQEKFSEKKFDFLKICDHLKYWAQRDGNNEIIKYTNQFRLRADLAILCRMMLAHPENTSLFKKEQNILVQSIKRNFFRLLFCNMPFSRKLVVFAIKINYGITCKFFNFFTSNIYKERK